MSRIVLDAEALIAHVAIVAATRSDILYPSNPSDLKRLINAYGAGKPGIVRC